MNPIMIHIIDMLKPVSISPEEINVENIKDIFTELEICDDSDMKLCIVPCVFTEKKNNIESYLPSILDPRVKKFDFAPDKIKQIQDLLRTRCENAKDNSTTSTPTANILSSPSYFHNAIVSPFYKPTLLNIFNNPPPLNLQNEIE
ncbi:14614_t:CDS:2, partial [Racocetra persica]